MTMQDIRTRVPRVPFVSVACLVHSLTHNR